jgi:hypothetical protein
MTRVNEEVWVKAFNELVDDGELIEKEGYFHLILPAKI